MQLYSNFTDCKISRLWSLAINIMAWHWQLAVHFLRKDQVQQPLPFHSLTNISIHRPRAFLIKRSSDQSDDETSIKGDAFFAIFHHLHVQIIYCISNVCPNRTRVIALACPPSINPHLWCLIKTRWETETSDRTLGRLKYLGNSPMGPTFPQNIIPSFLFFYQHTITHLSTYLFCHPDRLIETFDNQH